MPQEVLPATARAISLLLASNPAINDAHPGVIHQLLEFSHRYTHQVLSDALVYAEHAGRPGKLELDDVMLAVQARVGWELGGRVPKEYILSLATQTNAIPLPPVPEVFGVRLPPPKDCLTSIDFDLIPNKPPPGVQLFDEEIIEETDEDDDLGVEDEDDEMEEMDVSGAVNGSGDSQRPVDGDGDGYDGEDESVDAEALFEGEDDDLGGDVLMDSAQDGSIKRKLVEDDDYD